MQILQRLFKIAAQEPPKSVSNSIPITQKQGDKDQNIKSKDALVSATDCGDRNSRCKRVEKSYKLNCESLSLFCFLQRKDVSRPLFYHTLNLKRHGSLQRRRHSAQSVKMKKENVARGLGISNKADSTTHVGNKVLPISDNNQCPDSDKKEKAKGDKTKTISRMKELMKWAASTKGQRGGKQGIERKVLNFKKTSALQAVADDDQFSNESPKISFRWEMEICSNTSSVYSAISSSLKNGQIQKADTFNFATTLHVRNQCADGTGNWITTDSEFVVLEL